MVEHKACCEGDLPESLLVVGGGGLALLLLLEGALEVRDVAHGQPQGVQLAQLGSSIRGTAEHWGFT